MHAIQSSNSFGSRIRNFFFAREIPYGLAILRILLPAVLLLNSVPRWRSLRELYSLDGSPTPLAENYGHANFLPLFSGEIVVALGTALILLELAMLAGWCTRLATIGTLLLYTYFSLTDCISTATKYTVIASHILLIMSFSECGAIWSVDYWLRNRKHRQERGCDLSPESLRSEVWPARLIQILFCVVYLGAAMTKLRTPTFFTGDQLMWWMMTYVYQQHWLGDYMSQYPILLIAGAYATVIWEIVWIFCMWRRGLKTGAVALGVVFHLLTIITLGLVSFPLLMVSTYFAYLEAEDARRWAATARSLQRKYHWLSWLRGLRTMRTGTLISFAPVMPARTNWKAAGAFGLSLVALMGVGVGAEYLHDPYHLRGAQGPLALHAIDDADAARLLAPDQVLREQDKFFALDIGTTVVGDHLLDRRQTIYHNQPVFAQVSLSPPHEDMWVECQLFEAGRPARTAPQGNEEQDSRLVPTKLIDRAGMIFSREVTRGLYNYALGEQLKPGDYFFVVVSHGEPVLRKKITLLPRPGTLAAN